MPQDNKSVEDYLNEVSYSGDQDYIPSNFALEFVTFIKLVNGDSGEENKTPVLHFKMLDLLPGKKKNIANMLFRGAAKALDLNTEVLTPTGHVPLKNLAVGDIILDRDGKKTKIVAMSEIFNNPSYRITLTNGESFIANEDHIHIVEKRSTTSSKETGKLNRWKELEVTTKELLESPYYTREITDRNPKGREPKWYIPLVKAPIEFDLLDKPEIDPYTVGVILGDGNINKDTGFTKVTSHIDDVEELRSYIPYLLSDVVHDKRRHTTTSFSILGLGPLIKSYIGLNDTYSKYIPESLLYGSVEDRVEILRGLMDTDGTISAEGHCSFTSVSKCLAEGVHFIVKSLGGYSRISKHENNYAGYYNVSFNLQSINPFKLKRKADRWKPESKYKTGARIGIIDIERCDVSTQCIAVDSPTKSFLIQDCVITHNTTIMGEYLFLYLAVYGSLPGFGEVPLALYVSDSIENGVKNMRKNLEYRWENSEFLKKYVPVAKFTDIRWEFTNLEGKTLVVKGYGAQTGVRGSKEMGKRPVLAVLDDLVSDEDARSKTVTASIEDTVYKAVNYALHPTRNKIIWSGTPFNSSDPLYKAVGSGAWHVNVFPVCEQFPCEPEEFRGAWEDRFTYEYVKNEYEKAIKSGKIAAFNQELMLRIMSDEDRLILDEDITWYKRDTVISNKNLFNFYITTDFATSESNASDYSVISVWAYNSNGDWLWVDGICKRQLMDKNVDDLFRLAQKYKPQLVGIEVTGQQGGFISWIQNEMITRNIYFTLASEGNNSKPGIRPNTNKMQRFNIVVPWFKLGKIWFPEEMKSHPAVAEAMEELSLASPTAFKSRHDDWIDTCSMLGSLKAWKPSEEAVFKAPDGKADVWELDTEQDNSSNLHSYIV